jgi:predicted XRE-type DNA-binding protein
MKRDHISDDTVSDSSGNVFADLGLDMSEDDMLKVVVARAISNVVQNGRYTQAKAAGIMRIDQPKVSKLLRGRLDEFSVEWLMDRLLLLGYDIEFRARKSRSRERGQIRFVA